MERDHFGKYLRKHREACGLSLADLSRTTKIKASSLALLEEARLEALPARVFVVGWVTAYAREVGCDPGEALTRLWPHAPMPAATDISTCVSKLVARAPEGDQPSASGRRRVGVALVVFLLLIVATLTLSVLLGHGGPVGGPLS
jgi:cytoskeletal protein RodZ